MQHDQKKRGDRKTEQEIAVEWLNAALSSPKGKAAYRRVLGVYALLNDLVDGYAAYQSAVELLDKYADGQHTAKLKKHSDIPRKMLVSLAAKHAALNKALSRYRLTPQTQYFVLFQQWVTFNVSLYFRDNFEIPYDPSQPGMTINEGTVITALLSLLVTGELWRARLCPMCRERWKVQVRPMDKFCGDSCRIRFKQSTVEGRKRHNAAMKTYRNQPGIRLDNQGRKKR